MSNISTNMNTHKYQINVCKSNKYQIYDNMYTIQLLSMNISQIKYQSDKYHKVISTSIYTR